MSEPNQKPSIEEQYTLAIMRGFSGDLILAAGLQRCWAGALLLRLRTEYDIVRSELERAGQIAPSAGRGAWELHQEAERLHAMVLAGVPKAQEMMDRAEALKQEAAALQARTPAEVKTARAIILVSLKSLQAARREVGVLAIGMSAKPKRNLGADVALRMAGRVLDVWLDEVCHRCDGTKRIGNRYAGEQDRECPACKGTGHRRDILGANQHEALFAGDLLEEIQCQVAAAAAGIKAAMRADGGPAKPISPEFVRRLAELRGVDAAAD
jgi:hypothetical protein